ncbi:MULTISPECIES: hypothetical protein [unclassified Bartonella]|uniref:hypothetical protein n=1 Tax=unclassified Bartonella TaxID=2645622 RepID=UPI00099A5390|nr:MULTISPECIES: hypothetical protein [unclassified Bartonella]AQX22434.1 hypothetical protein Bho11B_004080 [Bartonella sp. 11B]AQX24285.1 hypothetical protein Bho114_009700 [Bartonella sp. 114]AQX24882.1 hypothetical protein Bco22_001810 [Bartonella sp. Coyote22sub2]
MNRYAMKILLASTLSVCCILTGCNLSAPTYGTDKTASLQFFDDITNLASLRSKNKNSQIVMKQRSKLVFPEPNAHVVLPPPQIDSTEINSHNEMEVSGQSQKNLRGGVEANRVNSHGNSSDKKLVRKDRTNLDDPEGIVQLNEKQQREEYLRRRKEAAGGSANYRRYLSEPPLIYRQPAVTAPAGPKR